MMKSPASNWTWLSRAYRPQDLCPDQPPLQKPIRFLLAKLTLEGGRSEKPLKTQIPINKAKPIIRLSFLPQETPFQRPPALVCVQSPREIAARTRPSSTQLGRACAGLRQPLHNERLGRFGLNRL
jgi:hypothetical protein